MSYIQQTAHQVSSHNVFVVAPIRNFMYMPRRRHNNCAARVTPVAMTNRANHNRTAGATKVDLPTLGFNALQWPRNSNYKD
jgi:hypothetical protein